MFEFGGFVRIFAEEKDGQQTDNRNEDNSENTYHDWIDFIFDNWIENIAIGFRNEETDLRTWIPERVTN